MKKIVFWSLAVSALAFVSCSQDEIVDNNPEVTPSVEPAKVLPTTSFSGYRGGDEETRTVVNVKDWSIGWNDGSTELFKSITEKDIYGEPITLVDDKGISTKTGMNVNKDHIAFLASNTGTAWAYTADINRQVFVFDAYGDKHNGHAELADGKCCATFNVANRPSGTAYEGLDPNTEYCGYYFLPFIKDAALPVAGDGSTAVSTAMRAKGYDPTPIQIGDWHQDGQGKSDIQRFVAEYDFMQAIPHNPDLPYNYKQTIKPSRDGQKNKETNSYDLTLDMVHTMALVEIDVILVEPDNDEGKNIRLNVAKIIGRDENDKDAVCFDVKAAIDGNANWTYLGKDDDLVVDGQTVTVDGKPVKVGIMVSCTRKDEEYTCYNRAPLMSPEEISLIQGKKTLKFFMFVRQDGDVHHYALQIFSGTNVRQVLFYPNKQSATGSSFRFIPGKYYRFVLKADIDRGTIPYDWQNYVEEGQDGSGGCTPTLTGVYPCGNDDDYWKITQTVRLIDDNSENKNQSGTTN